MKALQYHILWWGRSKSSTCHAPFLAPGEAVIAVAACRTVSQ